MKLIDWLLRILRRKKKDTETIAENFSKSKETLDSLKNLPE